MTLLGLSASQLALLFGGTAAAVTLLYILKLRRRQLEVPFAHLWAQVLKERQSRSLFRRLKRLFSLLIQLLILALVVLALGDPRLSDRWLSGRHIVLLLDTSASMQATDGEAGGARLADALKRAKELVRGKSGADRVMVVTMDHQVTPLGPFDGDETALFAQLETVRSTDTGADLPRALRFCADALRGKKDPMLVLVSDGAFSDQQLTAASWGPKTPATAAKDPQKPKKNAKKAAKLLGGGALDRVDLTGIDVRYLGVGQRKDNIGIVAFDARRYPRNRLGFEVFLEVVNNRDKDAEADLQFYSDGEMIEVQRLRLTAGERARFVCDPDAPPDSGSSWCRLAATGKVLEARLTSTEAKGALDPLAVDDRAHAVLPERRKHRVLLVTDGNLYTEGALLLDDSLDVTRVPKAAYDPAKANSYDSVVFDRWFPPEAPTTHSLVIAPPAELSPLPVRGTLQAPLITDQDKDHPVMRWITLKDINIFKSLNFARQPGTRALAASFGKPVIAARNHKGRRLVVLGFDVTRSDLPLRVAFPLLVINSLDWFRGEQESATASLKTGQSWAVPLGDLDKLAPAVLQVKGPDGRRFAAPVERGKALLSGEQAGVYTLSAGGRELVVAANLAEAGESSIAPRAQLALGGKTLVPPDGFGVAMRREVWIYLLLAALALFALEWLTYNRRMTV